MLPSSLSNPTNRPALETLPTTLGIRSISWAAILAGLTTALAMEVLFMLMGAGLGFAIYSPLTNDNPIADLSSGAMLIQGLSAVLSLWFGGWVAGRFSPMGLRPTGWLHGFLVWCAATVAGVLFVTAGAGWALGELSSLVGGGLSLAGKPAAAAVGGVADVAKNALQQSGDALASFTDEALENQGAAGGTAGNVRGTGANARGNVGSVRAKREIGLAVARLFNPAQESQMAANRSALVTTLAEQTSLSQAEADRVVTEWTATYQSLKDDLAATKEAAEQKAREAAETAAGALAIFSICAFVGFLIGAFAATWGGHQGAQVAFGYDGAITSPLTRGIPGTQRNISPARG